MEHTGDEHDTTDSSVWLKPGEEVLTPERVARGDTYTAEGDRGGRQHYTFESLLLIYLLRGHVSAAQYRAGNRFHCLWRNSILRTRYVQMRYTELRGTFDAEQQQAVPKEYLDARKAIRGEPERLVVYSVCVENEKAGKRGQMALLRSGLDDLARWFKEKDRQKRLDN